MRTYPKKLKPLETTLPEKFRNAVPNGKFSGTTWDARHLDSFLKDNTPNYKHEYLDRKQQLLDLKNQTLLSSGTSKSKESCIFVAKPRFTDEPSGYPTNDFHQFFSDLNTLAITQNRYRPINFPTIENAYKEQAKNKNFDENKLEPVQLPVKSLSTSKDKQKELWDLQNNRKEYSKWKKELANLTKAKRVLQSQFKSGAMNVDHPLNENSFYYSDMSQELKKKNQSFQLREESHRKYIDEHIRTCENIKFDNRHAWDRMKTEIINFDLRKKKNIDDFWKVKKKNSMSLVRNTATNDRIFGTDDKKNQLLGRAMFLREMETRNKKYNIVSLNYYEPEIKSEAFKKARDKNSSDFYFKN